MARPRSKNWSSGIGGIGWNLPQVRAIVADPTNPRWHPAKPPPGYGALPRPPVGTYDPAIDASERAAQRGYTDLQTDTGTQNLRAAADYGIGLEDIGRNRDYGLADLLRSETRGGEDISAQRGDLERGYGRNLADLLSARGRGTEDYNSNVQTLSRNYQRLGGQQAQSASAMGVDGAALMQALQKRTANEAIDRAPIDTNYGRFMADSQQSESRLGEDRTVGLGRLDTAASRLAEDIGTGRSRLTAQYGAGGQDYGTEGQRLSLGYQRGAEDRATGLRRAGRELTAYRSDLVPTRYYAAAGLTPYTPRRRRR